MKVLNRISFASLLVASCFSSQVIGATTQVDVTAVVVGTCQFNSAGTAVNFTLDPSSGTDVVATVVNPPQFWCTKGTAYSIADDGGLQPNGVPYEMKHSALAEYIPYSFGFTDNGGGVGSGKSTPIDITINATVVNAAYIDASVGPYSDKVILTITP